MNYKILIHTFQVLPDNEIIHFFTLDPYIGSGLIFLTKGEIMEELSIGQLVEEARVHLNRTFFWRNARATDLSSIARFWKNFTNIAVQSVRRVGDEIVAEAMIGGMKQHLRVEQLLVAAGLRANTDAIARAEAGFRSLGQNPASDSLPNDFFQCLDGYRRIGSHRIIGVYIRIPDNPVAVDNVASRHRQAP